MFARIFAKDKGDSDEIFSISDTTALTETEGYKNELLAWGNVLDQSFLPVMSTKIIFIKAT
jgi:hypothetical protein